MDQPEAPEHALGLSESALSPAQAQPIASTQGSTLNPEPLEVQPASPSPDPLPSDTAIQPFGAALAPTLLNLCDGRLSDINWFRTDWQRGGALTGFATWTDERGEQHPSVVKFPIPPTERRWLVQLSSDEVTPRVFAHGSELGGYDLAWVVMERLPFGPIGPKWRAESFKLIAEAAANFYASARLIPLSDPPKARDWEDQLKRSRDQIGRDQIADSQRWRKALKAAGKKLPKWLDTWYSRDKGYWCHGDLHPGNAMSRHPAPLGPAVLFDLANVRPGHWVEDAVYLEHLYWTNPAAMHGIKPVKYIAQRIRDFGLTPGDNWPELANIYRALLAMTAPATRNKPGGSALAAASLEVLERLV